MTDTGVRALFTRLDKKYTPVIYQDKLALVPIGEPVTPSSR